MEEATFPTACTKGQYDKYREEGKIYCGICSIFIIKKMLLNVLIVMFLMMVLKDIRAHHSEGNF